ncbi:MAG: hypothetical protein C0608_04525 [Deltaproteobacteria bacterium]|nr:MAG: hypothetical protein C0608_04525 [Deltaproteobacteria bacterium]
MNRYPYVFLTIMSIVWGCNFVAAKTTLAEMAPLPAAFWRYLIAVAALGPFAAKELLSILRERRQWRNLFILGFIGIFLYHWLFFAGLKLSEPGAASIVITSNPALTALLSALLLGEKLSWRRWLGFALAAFGALVVLSNGDVMRILTLDFGDGGFLLIGAVVLWSLYAVLGKRVMETISPLAATTAGFIVALPMFLIVSALEGTLGPSLDVSTDAWLGVVYMGIGASGVAFLLFFKGVALLGAARASIFIYLIPLFAFISSWLMLGESLTAAKLAGAAFVISGVTLTSKAK